MISGFFFDLDGTLVDTHQANYQAYRRAISEVSGVDISFDDFKRSLGHASSTFLPWFAPNLSQTDYTQMAVLKGVYYRELMHLTVLNRGLISLIDTIKTNATIALVTTAKRQNAEAVLKHHKIHDRMDFIIAGEDVARAKPDPAAYQLALDKTKLKPHEVIAFEDTEAGRLAAEAAGISVVMIDNFTP